LQSEANKKIVPLDYSSIQKQIDELESKRELASKDDASIDYDMLMEIKPKVDQLRAIMKQNKKEIAETKQLLRDASFAHKYCMDEQIYGDAKQWDNFLKAGNNILSIVKKRSSQ